MMACLEKDFRMMRNQVKFFVIIVIISVGLVFGNQQPFFAVPYLTFICSFLGVNAIGYDEAEKGFAFFFTLPVNRKEYVIEKYIFSILMTLFSALVGFLLLVFFLAKEKQLSDTGNYFFATCCLTLGMIVYMAVIFPFVFKMGVEKGRLMISAVMIALAGGFVLVMKLFPKNYDRIERLAQQIGESGKLPFLGLLAVGCLIITALSCLLSIYFMNQKEF